MGRMQGDFPSKVEEGKTVRKTLDNVLTTTVVLGLLLFVVLHGYRSWKNEEVFKQELGAEYITHLVALNARLRGMITIPGGSCTGVHINTKDGRTWRVTAQYLNPPPLHFLNEVVGVVGCSDPRWQKLEDAYWKARPRARRE